MSLKQFQILSKLGEGAYSSVYKAIRLADAQTYALKRVKLVNLSSKQKENALNEIRILASIRHPNVICYKQAFIDDATKSLCIVMQFANNGDLYQKITEKQKKGETFKQAEVWEIFIQIVKGLKQLHDLNIFHRDLKSANVFLTDEGVVKLGDMNVSKLSEKGLCLTQTGTPYYASPEVWKDQPYDSKSDIWSLGCVLYEMITLKPPFKAEDMEGLYKKVIRGIYPRIPSEFSQDISNLIRFLLQTNPTQRPSCQKILKMPTIIKRTDRNKLSESLQKPQLLKTIKAMDNLFQLQQQLPKANYLPLKVQKQKGIKSLIETLQGKTVDKLQEIQIQSLPALEKDRKIKPVDHSDRLMMKHKQSLNMIERQRKKSEMGVDQCLQVNRVKGGVKQLKLPRVVNRYNKQKKERIHRQNSLRAHGYRNF